MAMLPAIVRTANLHVDEAGGRVEFTNERAPAHRQPEPPDAIVEHGVRRHHRIGSQQLEAEPGWREQREVGRLGEEREHLDAGFRQPYARLEDVIGHGARAIIGSVPGASQTRAYVALL